MKLKDKIFRNTAILLSIIYLNFFFISPFIHAHEDHLETDSQQPILHSHFAGNKLFNDLSKYAVELEPNDNHNHLFEANKLSFIIFKRVILYSFDFSIYYFSYGKTFSGEKYTVNFYDYITDHYRLLRERSVQLAANSSPPQSLLLS